MPCDSTTDKPLFRLFVGWVPKLFTEQDLLPLFKKVCSMRVHEVALMHGVGVHFLSSSMQPADLHGTVQHSIIYLLTHPITLLM